MTSHGRSRSGQLPSRATRSTGSCQLGWRRRASHAAASPRLSGVRHRSSRVMCGDQRSDALHPATSAPARRSAARRRRCSLFSAGVRATGDVQAQVGRLGAGEEPVAVGVDGERLGGGDDMGDGLAGRAGREPRVGDERDVGGGALDRRHPDGGGERPDEVVEGLGVIAVEGDDEVVHGSARGSSDPLYRAGQACC